MSYFNITKKENRIAVYNRFGGRCAYCGIELDIDNFQVDHLRALKRGELNVDRDYSFDNCMPSCKQCNASKSSFTLEQWRKELELKVARLNKYHSIYRICKSFNLVNESGNCVIFHFEIYNQQNG